MTTAVRRPSTRLQPYVSLYAGYRFEGAPAADHAGLPSRHLTLIISLAAPISVSGPSGSGSYQAFVAGLHATPVWVRGPKSPFGVRLMLTPLGARALLGLPSAALAGQVVSLSDLLGARAEQFVERLSSASSWDQCFDRLESLLEDRIEEDQSMAPRLRRAWDRLLDSHGAAAISEVAIEAGWSRRHLAQIFASEIGLTPKTVARIARYERACRLIRSGDVNLAGVAADSGYADQAHLAREWTTITGRSPRLWMRDELPFLQDYEIGGGYRS